MQVKVLGGQGGVSLNSHATSYLIDDHFLIDAGSVAEALSIEDQLKIDHILISHQHLDHIKDLAFLCDNCFGLRPNPFEVYCSQHVYDCIKKYLFNEIIWPDFSILPSSSKPTIHFNIIEPEQKFSLNGYDVMPVQVNHPGGTLGYIIEKNNHAVLFTLDTAATERIWEFAKTYDTLKAIVTEVSFPNRLQNIADISFHQTPSGLAKEVEKMPLEIPIYLTHFKPAYKEELKKEIEALNNPRLKPLFEDGQTLK